MSLQGKRALVTGGSRGVGAATVRQLAGLGAAVALNYNQAKERAEAVVNDIRAEGGTAVPVQADISTDAAARALVAEAVEALGGLDILINNAAITHFIAADDLEGVSEEAWETIFATNVRGLFNVTRAAAPHLKAGGEGVVVNVGSVAGIGSAGSSIPYAASKAAVHSLTRTLARALAPEIRVNCVAPGFINTEWHLDSPDPDFLENRVRSVRESTLLQHVCEPEDIADAVVGLVLHSRQATGQVLIVNGGSPF